MAGRTGVRSTRQSFRMCCLQLVDFLLCAQLGQQVICPCVGLGERATEDRRVAPVEGSGGDTNTDRGASGAPGKPWLAGRGRTAARAADEH